ncbi:MAG: hypothetical protein ABJC63_04750 [Gemmatimonadales bacterium]
MKFVSLAAVVAFLTLRAAVAYPQEHDAAQGPNRRHSRKRLL